MTESPDDEQGPGEKPAEDKSAEERPSDSEGDLQVGSGEPPGEGGYRGRDPKKDMPRIPSIPETQDDE